MAQYKRVQDYHLVGSAVGNRSTVLPPQPQVDRQSQDLNHDL